MKSTSVSALKLKSSPANEFDYLRLDIFNGDDDCRGDVCKQLLANSLKILDFSSVLFFGSMLCRVRIGTLGSKN